MANTEILWNLLYNTRACREILKYALICLRNLEKVGQWKEGKVLPKHVSSNML